MINQADITEQEHIMELYTACREHMELQGIHQWNERYPNLPLVAHDIEQQSVYTLRKGDILYGTVTLSEAQPQEYSYIHWQDHNSNKVLTMYRLAVHPNWQGKGIARELIDFVESYALKHHYSSIRLDCYRENKRAYHLYNHLKYELRGNIRFDHTDTPFYCFEKCIPANLREWTT